MLHTLIGAEVREVARREHQGKPAHVVIASRLYPTDVADLWDAVTNPERIPRWFLPITGELREGGRYQLQGNAGGSITRCEKPTAFDVTWEFGGGMSWVSVRLTEEAKGTRLTLEHLVHAADVEEFWAKYGPGATGVGWDGGFFGLGRHLETGRDVTKEYGEAWALSDEGKAFNRASAEAWAVAHIASGEAPDVARGMAERTAAFYTGG
jgi:uncharacterized protein YndB with AHSA1/START domain